MKVMEVLSRNGEMYKNKLITKFTDLMARVGPDNIDARKYIKQFHYGYETFMQGNRENDEGMQQNGLDDMEQAIKGMDIM